MSIQQELKIAVEQVEETLANHPERRADIAEEYAMRGEPRPYPVIYIGRQVDTDAGEGLYGEAPPVKSPEERLLDKLNGIPAPLRMLNPISASINLGHGPGSLAASFGLPLDPALGFAPRGHRDIDELLAEGMPDPETSGIMPEIREDIEAARAYTPEWLRINRPDTQGPFNIAHMILGNDAFLLPYEEPEKFDAMLCIITEFYIEVDKTLRKWIGPERFPVFPCASTRIAECSVNLLSAAMYEEFVLHHDRKIVDYCGEASIHPCSGPHVFFSTIRNLPDIVYTEAGSIDRTAAGCISVADALAEIGDRPIILGIGQELPEGREEEFIRRDLDRARTNPRLLFGYTGMHWKKRDEENIREIHLRLDAYWAEHVWQGGAVSAGL